MPPRTTSRRTVAAIAVLLGALLLMASPVGAGSKKDSLTLEWPDTVDVAIENGDGETLKISYKVEVAGGAPVSVYFLDQEGYDDFKADLQFDAYSMYSNEGTKGASEEWVWDRKGDFYVVIATEGLDANASRLTYSVTWEPVPIFGSLPTGICIGIIVAVAAVIVAYAVWSWRSR